MFRGAVVVTARNDMNKSICTPGFYYPYMIKYVVAKPSELSSSQIEVIIRLWQIEEWQLLTKKEFEELFYNNEFHLLTDDDGNILSVSRINYNFQISVSDSVHTIAELVGFVSQNPRQGHGSLLFRSIVNNLTERGIEAIGFCEPVSRVFYEKCGVEIFYAHSRFIKEKINGEWVNNSDEDILNLSLLERTRAIITGLTASAPAYLISG